MLRNKLTHLAFIATALMSAFSGSNALAQAYPSRPVTIIFPFPTGNAVDQANRMVTAEVSKVLGQPLVYENRPGAKARLGIAALAKAPPDGYLLTIGQDGVMVGQPVADPDFKLEAGKDFAPVSFLFEFPFLLATSPTVPFRDLKGLVAYAKANPGKLNMAMTVGSNTHFVTEMFMQGAGIDITMIPYKGGDSMVDVSAGRVDMVFTSSTAAPFIKAGKSFGIATTGETRWRAFPDVPTFKESGLQLLYNVWFAVLAPAGTPPEIVSKLNAAFNAVLKLPQVRKQLEGYGFSADRTTSPNELAAIIEAERNVWRPIVKKAGIKLD